MQLTDDSLILGVIASEVGENTNGAIHDGHIIRAKKHDELTQQVIEVILLGGGIGEIPNREENVLDKTSGAVSEVSAESLHTSSLCINRVQEQT